MKKKLIRLTYTKTWQLLRQGIGKTNPIVVSVLGICSALAITNQVENAIAMGIGVTFVVMASSAFISLMRNIIPSQLRMVTYMVVISIFTISVQMFLAGYFPAIEKQLGAYVGLIITNCIVMGRAEAYAVKNPVRYSLIDGFANGMGYTIVLLLISSVREILANGTWLGLTIMPAAWPKWVVMSLAPGGFFVLALFVWLIRIWANYYEEDELLEEVA